MLRVALAIAMLAVGAAGASAACPRGRKPPALVSPPARAATTTRAQPASIGAGAARAGAIERRPPEPRYFARNSAILGPAGAMCSTPLRCPFGPPICSVSTGVPAPLIAAAVRSTHSERKTWSVGV
jgi:hypothetical protein